MKNKKQSAIQEFRGELYKEPSHTPTPWHVEKDKIGCSTIHAENRYEIASHLDAPDAAYIVTCVNAHKAYEYLAKVAGRIRSVLNGENKELLTKSLMENLLFEALEDIARAEEKGTSHE